MSAHLDLSGLTDADLAELIARAELLRAWIAAVGSETLLDLGEPGAVLSVTAVLGQASADDLAAGLAHRTRLLGLLALGVGLSTDLGSERFRDERLFESLRELNRVVLKEAVAGLTADGRDEALVAAAQVLAGGGGVGIDPGREQVDDVCGPRVEDAGELLAADRDGVGADGAFRHGLDLLARLMGNHPAEPEAEALQRAIAAAGGSVALARVLGISSPAISQWHVCPPRRVLAVESASGVSRHDLRPDLYPRAGAPVAATGSQSR